MSDPTANAVQSERRRRLAAARVVELLLILLGVRFVVGGDDSTASALVVLLLWDLLAAAYLTAGLVSARRHYSRPSTGLPLPASTFTSGASRLNRTLQSYRFKTLFTVTASLTGLTAAATVVINRDDDRLGGVITAAGVAGILLAWALLHAAYAQLYSALYFAPTPSGGGLQFPETVEPTQVEFLYFAFTLGTSFAASDVTVTGREFRWRVTVHSVVSFFYNAIVLALAINILISL